MKNQLIATLAAACALLFQGCATKMSNDPSAPSGAPDATVKIDIVQASYYAAAGVGSGRLRYHGRNYPFSIKSIGGGGLGAQTIRATGKVYHLKSLASFPGTYIGARSGITLGEGGFHERLENNKGTVIYLTGKTSGLATSRGIDKFLIQLK